MSSDAVESRSDQELLEAHLAGDPESFGILAARYARELFSFLVRFVGDAALADDLVQETFLQVHYAASSFDRTRAFKPWLYTVAANKARDQLRTRARRMERSLEAEGAETGRSLGDGVEALSLPADETLDAAELRQRVQSVIERMPEHLRTILLLGYYQQLPYAEIAEVLDIPVGTVKSRLHAAVGFFGKLWRREARSSLKPG